MDKLLKSNRYALFFIGPALLIFVVFGLVPIGFNAYLSFFKTDLMSPAVYCGLKNYKNLITDSFFIIALKNNLILILGVLAAHLVFSLFLSYFMFQKPNGVKFFQAAFFLPSVICGTAIGMLWNFIYHPQFGLLDSLLGALGLDNITHLWLAEKETVLPALMAVTMWQYVGYHMVIQLAAMKNIPPDILEAAHIDGATRRQQFFKIVLPLIKNVLGMDAILIVTGSLKTFDLVFIMTSGGPSHASEVMCTYMYTQGFKALKFGYSSAIAVVLLLACTIAIWIIKRIAGTESYEY